MPYIVSKVNQQKQVRWDDILFGKLLVFPKQNYKTTNTITHTVRVVPKKYRININKLEQTMYAFYEQWKHLIEQDKTQLYNKFYIPKAHGGKREINEPIPEMKLALNSLRHLLESDCNVLYHTSAFAYIPGRCTKDMDMKHALNKSNWFLKTDFKGFFPSINLNFTVETMRQIYPFNVIARNQTGRNLLRKVMSLAFLNDGLPQGSPVSPCISNLIMIPIDHKLFNYFAHKKMVYTRYADDIVVSCEQTFDAKEMVAYIQQVLKDFNAPFGLNHEKTKYVSNKGSNWMLGLMVNKDHQVTVGHKNKKFLKASLCNFIMDEKNGKPWDIDDVRELQGDIAYYKMIEKSYISYIIDHMNQKFNVNIESLLKQRLTLN